MEFSERCTLKFPFDHLIDKELNNGIDNQDQRGLESLEKA